MMFLWLLLIIVSSVWIMFACNPFEQSADYLGRNLGYGIKGATINAIGSSLPELSVSLLCLFVFKDTAGFSSGIATSAGSAVFNAAVIPALVLMTITLYLKIKGISIDKSVIMRDGIIYVLAIIVFTFIISRVKLTWWMGLVLMGIYTLYVYILVHFQGKFSRANLEKKEGKEEEEISLNKANPNRILAFLRFDYKIACFPRSEMNNISAWTCLLLSVINIGAACYLLTYSVVEISKLWHMSPFFVAVILAAAATSVPDTIISVKDALKGNYEDAISNALGSNIFDICIGLGLPIFIYTIFNGSLSINPQDSAGVLDLVLVLMYLTLIVLFCFIVPRKIGIKTGIFLFILYLGYCFYAISCGLDMSWVKYVSAMLSTIADFLKIVLIVFGLFCFIMLKKNGFKISDIV
jgi:cation:H+ antiporter